MPGAGGTIASVRCAPAARPAGGAYLQWRTARAAGPGRHLPWDPALAPAECHPGIARRSSMAARKSARAAVGTAASSPGAARTHPAPGLPGKKLADRAGRGLTASARMSETRSHGRQLRLGPDWRKGSGSPPGHERMPGRESRTTCHAGTRPSGRSAAAAAVAEATADSRAGKETPHLPAGSPGPDAGPRRLRGSVPCEKRRSRVICRTWKRSGSAGCRSPFGWR